MDSAATTIQSKCLWSFLLIVTFLCNGTFSDMGKMSSSQNHFGNTAQSQFATKNNTRVIAQKGGLAILPCVVKLNSPATVSWIRRKDFQLLTVGLSTHSSDKRFLVEHTRHMGHWSLRIKSVREEDRGFYECQLSIYPTQSIFIELKVVEAVAEITGAPDLHIDEGSALRLECKLKRATENPAFVFWYHDNKMVNYDAQDGFSVTSTAENIPPSLDGGGAFIGSGSSLRERGGSNNNNNNHSSHTNGHLSSLASLMAAQQHQSSYLLTPSTSVLTIQEVHFHHAGNYTCAPSNARPASITVHVLRGEKPAAMQHANRSVLDSEISNSSSGGSGGGGSVSTSGAYSISGPSRLVRGCAVKLRQVSLVLQQICQQIYQHYQRQQPQQQQQQQQPQAQKQQQQQKLAEQHEQQQQQSQPEQQHWCPGSLTWLLALVTLISAYHKIDR